MVLGFLWNGDFAEGDLTLLCDRDLVMRTAVLFNSSGVFFSTFFFSPSTFLEGGVLFLSFFLFS